MYIHTRPSTIKEPEIIPINNFLTFPLFFDGNIPHRHPKNERRMRNISQPPRNNIMKDPIKKKASADRDILFIFRLLFFFVLIQHADSRLTGNFTYFSFENSKFLLQNTIVQKSKTSMVIPPNFHFLMFLFSIFNFCFQTSFTVTKSTGNIVKCLNAITNLEEFSKKAGGSTCLGCDPTLDTCPDSCQVYIDTLWKDCQGISLADGIYFDPPKTITGEINEILKKPIF